MAAQRAPSMRTLRSSVLASAGSEMAGSSSQQHKAARSAVDKSSTAYGEPSSTKTQAIKTPALKKVKKGPVRYQCTSCVTDRLEKLFPNYNPTGECEHLINTCKDCLKKWVAAQVEGGKTIAFVEEEKECGEGKDGEGDEDAESKVENRLGVRCPECEKVMKSRDVQMAVSQKMYQRFDDLERRHIRNNTPGWRWCLDPNCDAGQLHKTNMVPISKNKSRVGRKWWSYSTKPNDFIDICTCHKCGFAVCVPCDRPSHEGESCAAYQERIRDKVEEEDKSLDVIRKHTKKCPMCTLSIEKAEGCNSMICAVCQTNFCWGCLEVYRGATDPCACGLPNPHPH